MTFKPPSPPYLGPPAKFSAGDNKPIKRIVIHSAVIPCEPGRARQLARMNREGTGGGSWHYAVDPDEVIQCSHDGVICWHAPPNANSIGIEMADWPEPLPAPEGSPRWDRLRSRWRWNDRNHRKMLNRTARLTARLCLAYGLPIKYRTAADLAAGKRGITTHAQVSAAFGQSTHWDPGFWPRYGFMRKVRRHARRIRRNAA